MNEKLIEKCFREEKMHEKKKNIFMEKTQL